VLGGHYEIVSHLASGGFGIVYEARDLRSKGERLAIKEFFPQECAVRVQGSTVSMRSPTQRQVFKGGLDAFIDEARHLRALDHPNIVRVHEWFEENGTAYIVMRRVEGRTLEEILENEAPPDAERVERWLRRLLDALAVLHEQKLLHRDISPRNIMIGRGDDQPVLIDFGAARQCIGKASQRLDAIGSPGYSPIEQGDELGLDQQNAATDIYALGATMYHVVTRSKPQPATSRANADRLRPSAELAAGDYPPRLLKAIDKAMALRSKDRWQSAAEFLAALQEATRRPQWKTWLVVGVAAILLLGATLLIYVWNDPCRSADPPFSCLPK
jgi:hypothetical protein